MKGVLFACILGTALGLQAPLEHRYRYEGLAMTGIEARTGQTAITGLKAIVSVKTDEHSDATVIQLSDVQTVDEKSYSVNALGVIRPEPIFKPFGDFDKPVTFYLKRNNGEVVMEAAGDEKLYALNMKKAIANVLRMATKTAEFESGQTSRGMHFTRKINTYAGDCDVKYSRIQTRPPTNFSHLLSEDIQSMNARKTSAGRSIQLSEEYYKLTASLDYSTCSDRVVVMHYGMVNQTNVTDTQFKEATSRNYHAEYLLKGDPKVFRVEKASVISQYIANPFMLETDKMVVVSNQTLSLISAKILPRSPMTKPATATKSYKTWHSMIQSTFAKAADSPIWVDFTKTTGRTPTYPSMVSGIQHEPSTNQVIQDIKFAASRMDMQNEDSNTSGYGGSQDGMIAEKLYSAQLKMRAMSADQLNAVEAAVIGDEIMKGLFFDLLAAAATMPALDKLIKEMTAMKIHDEKIASYFFTLGNNIQTPENLKQLTTFIRSRPERQHPKIAATGPLGLAVVARRLCVSPERDNIFYKPVYASKQCKSQDIVPPLVSMFKEKAMDIEQLEWVRIINILAQGELGSRQGIPMLQELARRRTSENTRAIRTAAIYAMAFPKFMDEISRNMIFSAVLPIAESPTEDYRVRQMAYSTLLSWPVNATFVQRMSRMILQEESVDMQDFMRSIINDMSAYDDPDVRRMTTAAQDSAPLTRYVRPALDTPMFLQASLYTPQDRIGSMDIKSWMSQLEAYLPTGLSKLISMKAGRIQTPMYEGAAHVDDDMLPSYKTAPRTVQAKSNDPEVYLYKKLFSNMVAFRPVQNVYSECKMCALYPVSEICPLCYNVSDTRESKRSTVYLSARDSSVIMPMPMGLFFEIKAVSPTLLHMNMKNEIMKDDKTSETGIIKMVTKTDIYATIHNPMTQKSVMAAIDNEKTFSMPLNYQKNRSLEADFEINTLNLTSRIDSTSRDMPMMKTRNLPYTAVATAMGFACPGDQDAGKYVITPASWIYHDQQKVVREMDFSTMEGVNLDVKMMYEGQAVYPLNQASVWHYMIEDPSHALSLLLAPTARPYNFTLYQKRGAVKPTISATMRSITVKGSGPVIEHSEHCPDTYAKLDISDSFQQRVDKLKTFASSDVTGYSVYINLTGKATNVFEYTLTEATKENTEVDRLAIRNRKFQLTYLEKRSSRPNNQTAVVWCTRQPQFMASARVGDLAGSADTTVAMTLKGYAAERLTDPKPPSFIDGSVELKMSDMRKNSILKSFAHDSMMINNTLEFYNLAVNDEFSMDLKANFEGVGGNLSREGEMTLYGRDIFAGYSFPNTYMTYSRTPKVAEFSASSSDVKRSVSTPEVSGSVRMSDRTMFLEHLRVHPVVDYITDFTPSKTRPTPPVMPVQVDDACKTKPNMYAVAYTYPYIVCRAAVPFPPCMAPCRVIDSIPLKMKATCWKAWEAPSEVKTAVKTGYTSAQLEGPIPSVMYVQQPTVCYA